MKKQNFEKLIAFRLSNRLGDALERESRSRRTSVSGVIREELTRALLRNRTAGGGSELVAPPQPAVLDAD